MKAKVTSIGHIAFNVADLDKSLEFYVGCLGFQEKFRVLNREFADSMSANLPKGIEEIELDDPAMSHMLAYLKELQEHGDEVMMAYVEVAPGQLLELFPRAAAKPNDRVWPLPEIYGYNHLSLMAEDIFAVKERLVECGMPIISDVSLGMEHTWQLWAADPDGNPIEFMQYTDESWQLVGK